MTENINYLNESGLTLNVLSVVREAMRLSNLPDETVVWFDGFNTALDYSSVQEGDLVIAEEFDRAKYIKALETGFYYVKFTEDQGVLNELVMLREGQ